MCVQVLYRCVYLCFHLACHDLMCNSAFPDSCPVSTLDLCSPASTLGCYSSEPIQFELWRRVDSVNLELTQ